MRISDWRSDVCSSDLRGQSNTVVLNGNNQLAFSIMVQPHLDTANRPLLFGNGLYGFNGILDDIGQSLSDLSPVTNNFARANIAVKCEGDIGMRHFVQRSEEHTSELQSLMRISYAVCCLKKKN